MCPRAVTSAAGGEGARPAVVPRGEAEPVVPAPGLTLLFQEGLCRRFLRPRGVLRGSLQGAGCWVPGAPSAVWPRSSGCRVSVWVSR